MLNYGNVMFQIWAGFLYMHLAYLINLRGEKKREKEKKKRKKRKRKRREEKKEREERG